jgi:hypothetical protein
LISLTSKSVPASVCMPSHETLASDVSGMTRYFQTELLVGGGTLSSLTPRSGAPHVPRGPWTRRERKSQCPLPRLGPRTRPALPGSGG